MSLKEKAVSSLDEATAKEASHRRRRGSAALQSFRDLESDVRSYIRSFPAVFDRAEGALLWDNKGKQYIDFLAGAGTLNYGHNPERVLKAIQDYVGAKGIIHSLDKATLAKEAFLETFHDIILAPRNMDYKVQFTGPTGTNAVESALKLARMVKQRSNIIAFTNGYHGLTLGALGVTGNFFYRDESFGHRTNTAHMPYDGFLGDHVDSLFILRRYLDDSSSGVDLPAAVIVETVQGEGGVNVASFDWLRRLHALCREYDILMIVDDIQMGNGRTGPFFSYEYAGIEPDMVCLSKSIGGGLPMALLLMRRELDQWKPGEHTGTFRGNNLAFVAATECIKQFWMDDLLTQHVHQMEEHIDSILRGWADESSDIGLQIRGRGMVWGLEFADDDFAGRVSKIAFENQLIAEVCGSENEVMKLLPPLTIPRSLLDEGLEILRRSILEARESQ